MGLRLPDSTFPPLEFSPEEEQALVDIADHIVAETLQLHDDFVADNRRLPKKEWKLVKTRDNVQVYKKRRVKEGVVQRPRLLSGTLDESHMHQTNYSHSHSSSNELPGGPPRLQQLNSSSRSQQSHSASSSAGRVSESEFGDSVMMCAKCSVEKKVTVDIAEEITQKALAFCLRCVIDAKKLSAWDIALTEVGG
ncbi:hypothetical protein PybrP1_003550 [[Pythium] brassicae (nom. inval.)]|nr:hypothetical protein PybrP1_003550 [[Pythium] brassicae (nom. inval.)]